jgi:hypothetical protein
MISAGVTMPTGKRFGGLNSGLIHNATVIVTLRGCGRSADVGPRHYDPWLTSSGSVRGIH